MGAKPKTWRERVVLLAQREGNPTALAARLGVSYWTVLRWINGQSQVSKLAQIALESLEAKR